MNIDNSPGLYGKIPVVGDFVSRRLPNRFIETWDIWLQSALTASRGRLGSKWLEIYLTSPIWRFILSPGLCGPSAWAGTLMPSVDKVGRYFPLTLAVSIGKLLSLSNLFIDAADWFDELEQMALAGLEDDLDLDQFDRKLQDHSLSMPAGEINTDCDSSQYCTIEGSFAVSITLDNLGSVKDMLIQMNSGLLTKFLPDCSLWCTSGSEYIKPSLRIYESLPPPEAYADFLIDLQQSAAGNIETAAEISPGNTADPAYTDAPGAVTIVGSPSIKWRSCGLSTVGRRRKINEDAFLEHPDTGLWAVADGMGGHKAGDVASKAAIDALDRLVGSGNLETLTAGAKECLLNVNSDLLAMADGFGPNQIIGTTVVVMLAVGERCATVWAGDSRLYQYRDGILSQLTEDHSLTTELSRQGVIADDEVTAAAADNIVTRALGAEQDLLIDFITFEARQGDAYLLCSDGLTKEMNSQEIADILRFSECRESSQCLIDLALERGARDNVTVVVVDAGRV